MNRELVESTAKNIVEYICSKLNNENHYRINFERGTKEKSNFCHMFLYNYDTQEKIHKDLNVSASDSSVLYSEILDRFLDIMLNSKFYSLSRYGRSTVIGGQETPCIKINNNFDGEIVITFTERNHDFSEVMDEYNNKYMEKSRIATHIN